MGMYREAADRPQLPADRRIVHMLVCARTATTPARPAATELRHVEFEFRAFQFIELCPLLISEHRQTLSFGFSPQGGHFFSRFGAFVVRGIWSHAAEKLAHFLARFLCNRLQGALLVIGETQLLGD